MKILAIESQAAEVQSNAYEPYLKEEALKVWELYKKGIIREIYFREEWKGAVIILECENYGKASEWLNLLPLVKNNLIKFEIIPLIPYPGFERLFDKPD